jgi:sortase A
MKMKKIKMRTVCIAVGSGLIAAALILAIFWQWSIHQSARRSEGYVKTIRSSAPAPQGALLQERSDAAMPVLSVAGTDFIGILEIPRFGSALPIGADWGKVSKFPCRYEGSIYGENIKIGATSQKGQYDFYRELEVGDAVLFTDVAGNQYTFTIQDIRYEKTADQAALERQDASLTLFIKNLYAFEYIVVSCQAQ